MIKKYNRGFIDGCFDIFHYGHVYALFQAKNQCQTLLAGTHSDEEIKQIKNSPPLLSYNDRSSLLKSCRFIDEYVGQVPYNTSIDIINKYNCEIFSHGSDGIDDFPLLELKNKGKLHVYNRTNGVSTSNLIKRILDYKNNIKVKTNQDFIYLKHIFNEIQNKILVKQFDKIIIVKCCWDLFNIDHLKLLENIKKKYPDYGLNIDLTSCDNYDIFNKYEVAIILLGFKCVDKVIVNEVFEKNVKEIILINNTLLNNPMSYIDTSFDEIINYIENNKYIYLKNLNLDIYKNKIQKTKETKHLLETYKIILKNQFDNILYLLKNTKFNENDIIIFDIDEVCLCNLMYNDVDIIEFGDETYNYTNGLIPINEECRLVFEFIHQNNIKYAFITGRRDYIRDITIENLILVNLDHYSHLFTCPNDYIGEMKKFKEMCRKTLTQEQLNIVYTIGDQLSDISGSNNGVPILLYNPFYKTD